MKKIVAAAVVIFAYATPVHATEWLICSDAEKKASFSVLLGSLGIGTASDFEVQAGEKSWSTKPGQGTPITKMQAFESSQMLFADVATEDLSEVVAELRVFRASEGDDDIYGGTLRIPGIGAYAVKCE